MNTGHVPDIDPKTATGQQAHDYMIERQPGSGRGCFVARAGR